MRRGGRGRRLHHHRRLLGSERRKAAPTRTSCATSRNTSGLLLAGPNTIGMVNAEVAMMGSFVNFPRWEPGGVSFFTQTGIFTGAVMLHVMSGATQRLPVGKSIDVGNKVDVDELDFLNFVADDPGTKVIGFYIESIRNPRAFFAQGQRSAQDQTDRGAQAGPDRGRHEGVGLSHRIARLRRCDSRRRAAATRYRARRGRGRLPQRVARARDAAATARPARRRLPPPAALSASSRPTFSSGAISSLPSFEPATLAAMRSSCRTGSSRRTRSTSGSAST